MEEFNPNSIIIRLFIQGILLEEKGQRDEAASLFLQGWNETTTGLEKFLAAHFLARVQNNVNDKLAWLQAALKFALAINDHAVKGSIKALYAAIARCYDELGDGESAKRFHQQATSYDDTITDNGPFYHGTKADLPLGDFLVPGKQSNYEEGLMMNHIYFTGLLNGAALAAALAKGEGRQRIYIVVPMGSFESDPNVTDKKFPGNITRSYRTLSPLKIVGEVPDWATQSPELLQGWREKLANNKGEIIN